MIKYLALLLLVSCGNPVPPDKLDSSIKRLQAATRSLEFSTNHLICTTEIQKMDLQPAIKQYNITSKDQLLFYINHLVIECLTKQYSE